MLAQTCKATRIRKKHSWRHEKWTEPEKSDRSNLPHCLLLTSPKPPKATRHTVAFRGWRPEGEDLISDGVRLRVTLLIFLWVKGIPGTQKTLLVKGKLDQNLWSPRVFFLTYSYICSWLRSPLRVQILFEIFQEDVLL